MNIEKEVKSFLDGISQTSTLMFVGSTTKNPLSYTVGEPIVFKIRVESDDKVVNVPYIQYFLEGDDGQTSEGYIESESDGWFYVETSLNRDGFVHLKAKACDENKEIIEGIDIFEGGAGADIDKIQCVTDIPDDYFDFWNAVKEEALSIPKEVIYKKEIDAPEGFVGYDVRLKTTNGDFVSCMYTHPKDAKEGTLKLAFGYMGYGLTTVTPTFLDGYLYVTTNTHDIPNGESPEYYANLLKTKYASYGLKKEENQRPETTYWKKMFVRDMQSFFYFKDHPLADGKNFVFRGGSQGAMRACNMASHTGYATQAMLNVPWFGNLLSIKKEDRIKMPWGPFEDSGLVYFDTAVAGKFLKCPVYIEAGLGDYICPPSTEMALYNSITTPKKIRFIQNRTHSYKPKKYVTYELEDSYNGDEVLFLLLN